MRILIIANVFHNYNKSFGGGGDVVLKNCFSSNNFKLSKIDLISNKNGYDFYKKNIKFDKLYLVPNKIINKKSLIISYFLRSIYVIKYAKILKDYDLIYLSSDFIPDLVPIIFQKFFFPKGKYKLIAPIFHFYGDIFKRKSKISYNIIGLISQKLSIFLLKIITDKVYVINKTVRDQLISKHNYNHDKVFVNYPGINIQNFKKFKIDGKFFIYVGRLSESKGLNDLIDSIIFLKKQKKSFPKILIVGNGSDNFRKKIINKININNLQNYFKFLNFINEDEKNNLLSNASLLIQPSHEEGFSLIIGEAMMLNTPVLAWNLSVYEEIFEDNIIKVSCFDIQDMAYKINMIYEDINSTKIKVKKANSFIKKYNWDNFARKLVHEAFN